jgi:tetratricopeptide (TPR) repeat protein
MKCLAKVVLVLLLLLTAGFGQSVAELLEKAIYTQETIGNLDGAIQIYRQILKSAPKDRAYAAQAQYRLAECLLAKGDLKGALQEYGNLTRNYPDSNELVAALAGLIRTNGVRLETGEEYGRFKDGRYHNNATGLEIVISSDWTFLSQGSSSGAGQMALFRDVTGQVVMVWMRKETIPETEKSKRLEWEITSKPQQRYWQDFKDYRIRPESVQYKTIGGNPAVSAVADYSGTWGEKAATGPMTEYLVWICGKNTYVQFFARTAPADLPALQNRIEELIESAVIP